MELLTKFLQLPCGRNRIVEKVILKKTKGIGRENAASDSIETTVTPFLPDDIIINILSMLPVKKASQCRLVCKAWRDLISTGYFVELNFRYNKLPMIMVLNHKRALYNYKCKTDFLLLDKWWELPIRKKLRIHEFKVDFSNDPPGFPSDCRVIFSHVGLVVYYSSWGRFIVANPMDHKNVMIFISREIRWSQIYGVYFHPSRKEYCSLWMILESDLPLGSPGRSPLVKWIKYKIISFGPNPSMKTISNPFIHRVKRPYSTPVYIDKNLYWMLEPENDEFKYCGCSDIMRFDIIGEEFTVMPCPAPLNTKISCNMTYLLNIDGILSFLVILPTNITIWRLEEDDAQQVWTTAKYTFTKKVHMDYRLVVAIVDGKLALLSKQYETLIVCDLVLGTMDHRKMNYIDVYSSIEFHHISLASLTNCTPKIFIDQEGELAQTISLYMN